MINMICNVQTFHIVISGLNENGNDVDIVPKLDAHNARYKYTCVCEAGTLLFPGATLDHVTTLISKRAVSELM